ncbi:MAG: ABC transporter ATP-binding protein [Actinomycetota bacterium]|nr:ABC transporter ATP-binding protein [Actinomycetota bacterium]
MSRIDCKNVWKIYQGDVVGVRDLNFTCNDKEFLAILGPSGSGKSSTLRMLAGLEEISKGDVLFDGERVNEKGPADRNIALAFESYALYYSMDVYENIAFPLRARGIKGEKLNEMVMEIVEALNLQPILRKKPGSLAGGYQQRVSLARALVRKPKLTLLDEPLSHMDQRIRGEIRAQISRIHKELGNTTIYVTHDQAEAIALCDRILVMHEAERQQIGTVDEIYNQPVNKFVANFIGQPGMNFINCGIDAPNKVFINTDKGKQLFEIAGKVDDKFVGSDAVMGVRPQQIKVIEENNRDSVIAGTVRIVEFQGDSTVVTAELGDESKSMVQVVITAGGVKFKRGDTCWMEFEPNNIHLFDKDSEKAIINR